MFAVGNHKEALKNFCKALQCRRKEIESSKHYFTEAGYTTDSENSKKKLPLLNDYVIGKLMNNIACLFYHQKFYALALKSFDEARDVLMNCSCSCRDTTDDAVVLDVSISACNIACTFVQLQLHRKHSTCSSDDSKYLQKAIALLETAIEYQKTVLHYGHALIVTTLENLTTVHALNSSYDKQLEVYFEILQIHERRHGKDHARYAKIRFSDERQYSQNSHVFARKNSLLKYFMLLCCWKHTFK